MQLLSHDAVRDLRHEAGALVPGLVTLGIAERRPPSQVSLLYSYPFGVGQFALRAEGIVDAVVAVDGDLADVELTATPSGPPSAFEAFLRQGAARRVVSVPLPGSAAATRLWVASTAPDPLPAAARPGLDALAARIAARLAEEESAQDALLRHQRLEHAAALVPALLHRLDVREVFDRVSATAKRALPHDVLLLRLFSDDLSSIIVYASTDDGTAPHAIPNAYPAAMIEAWSFDIVDDLQQHPYEATQPTARLGARSSLRVPIWIDDRVVGGLAAVSMRPAAFTTSDVPVARRLAEYVAVGLSHFRLAEERRVAAALRERTANLEMLDGLLGTLAGVLDIRDVFERVSTIAQKVLPHDALSILEIVEDGAKARVHASHGLGDLPVPHDVPMAVPALTPDRLDARIVDDYRDRPEYATGPGARAGMRSALFVPILIEGKTFGGVNFYSRTPRRFTKDDVLVARRITDHVALALSHGRLADQIRVAEELRSQAMSLELLDQLLATVIDTGGIPDTFERVSAIARKVLPHDALAMPVFAPGAATGRRYAATGLGVAAEGSIDIPDAFHDPDWDFDLIDDVTTRAGDHNERVVGLGFRSVIRMPIRLDGQTRAVLVFLAKHSGAFTGADVKVARRMADRIAVTLARDTTIEASRRADEATERAARLEARVRALTDELDARTGYRRVIGESKSWRHVLTQATQVAATDTTALLLGESGTGKEVVARFVHRASPRSGGPFVALNCAALPEQLLEAELFGYERGAFTGAVQSKPGQLEQAAGGTLFLDEVGEMSPTAQAKFLRVLQEREFQRLGGTRVIRSEARVVAATNRDLPKAIAQGQFREDLYYRLNVFAIRLPALRDRRDDVLPLSDAFLSEIGKGLGRPPGGISRDARELLLAYHWPGNVRELRNILERAAILCEGGLITADLLGLHPAPAVAVSGTTTAPAPMAMPAAGPAAAWTPSAPTPADGALAPPTSADALASIEKAMIENALASARFNKSKAAKALNMTRHQLYIRMRKHGLE